MNILSVPSPSSLLTMSPVPQGGFGAPSVARVLSSDVWCDGQSGWRRCRAACVGDLLQLGQQGICRGLEKSSAIPQGYEQRGVAFLPGPCFLLLPPVGGGAAAGAPAQAMPGLEQLSHLLFTYCGLHTNGGIALCTSSLPHAKVLLFHKITGTQRFARSHGLQLRSHCHTSALGWQVTSLAPEAGWSE